MVKSLGTRILVLVVCVRDKHYQHTPLCSGVYTNIRKLEPFTFVYKLMSLPVSITVEVLEYVKLSLFNINIEN